MIIAEILSDNTVVVYDQTVSDSIKHETIKFIFPDSWHKYQKTAVFKLAENNAVNVVLDENNPMCISNSECYIPNEVIKAPGFSVSVFGVFEDFRATTSFATVRVIQSGYELGGKPEEPTPDEYAQITQIMEETKKATEAVKDYVDLRSITDDTEIVFDGGTAYNPEIDIELTVENLLDEDSVNPISNKAVTEAIKKKVNNKEFKEALANMVSKKEAEQFVGTVDEQLNENSGNPISNKAVTEALKEKIGKRELLNSVFPIGYIYISVNDVNPRALLGGTWRQIKDLFLLACGDIYSAGKTGGEATHTLTVEELPEHRHEKIFVNTDNTESIEICYRNIVGLEEGQGPGVSVNGTTGFKTGLTGLNTPHNNMPPYLAVYMWERIA